MVPDWLIEAERIASNNGWTPQQKIRFFSDRLKDDALEWHLSHMEANTRNDYAIWKKEFIEQFSENNIQVSE